jgi:hypothetical protein
VESQYLVIIQVPRPDGPRQSVQHQLTYEVTHLRPGQNQWSLVSEEDFPKQAGSTEKAPCFLRK